MTKIYHNDDGKGKWNSHQLTLKISDYYDIGTAVELTNDEGAETVDEAKEELLVRLDELIGKLQAARKDLSLGNIDMVKVDCFGKEIK